MQGVSPRLRIQSPTVRMSPGELQREDGIPSNSVPCTDQSVNQLLHDFFVRGGSARWVVIPGLMLRILPASEALGLRPLHAAARTHTARPESVPDSCATLRALPTVFCSWVPLTFGAINFGFVRHGYVVVLQLSQAYEVLFRVYGGQMYRREVCNRKHGQLACFLLKRLHCSAPLQGKTCELLSCTLFEH